MGPNYNRYIELRNKPSFTKIADVCRDLFFGRLQQEKGNRNVYASVAFFLMVNSYSNSTTCEVQISEVRPVANLILNGKSAP